MTKPKWIIEYFINDYLSTKLETDVEGFAKDFLVRREIPLAAANELFRKVGHSNSASHSWVNRGSDYAVNMNVVLVR